MLDGIDDMKRPIDSVAMRHHVDAGVHAVREERDREQLHVERQPQDARQEIADHEERDDAVEDDDHVVPVPEQVRRSPEDVLSHEGADLFVEAEQLVAREEEEAEAREQPPEPEAMPGLALGQVTRAREAARHREKDRRERRDDSFFFAELEVGRRPAVHDRDRRRG